MMKTISILTCSLLILFVCNAQAITLSYQFSGTIDEIQGSTHEDFFNIGGIVTGRYTFNSASEDFNSEENIIQTKSIGDPYGFEFIINGITFSTDIASMLFANDNSGEDRYDVNATQEGLHPSGNFEGFELNGGLLLVDHSQQYFSGDEVYVPLITPDLSLFDYTKLRFGGSDGTNGSQFGLTANITKLTSIPVPASVWLFGSGLIGLIGVARRKKV